MDELRRARSRLLWADRCSFGAIAMGAFGTGLLLGGKPVLAGVSVPLTLGFVMASERLRGGVR